MPQPNPVVTIESIRAAIIRQEGEPANGLNPGNLRGAPWMIFPIIENGFWVPASREAGIAGLDHLIALHRAEGNTRSKISSQDTPESTQASHQERTETKIRFTSQTS